MATQHQIEYSFFGSDHSNIEIVHKETHQALNLAQTATDTASAASKTADAALGTADAALTTAEAASKTAQAASDTAQTALNTVDAFGARLGTLEAAQGVSDGTGVVGDAAALIGDVTETIGDSDRIMLGCTIAAAVAVTVMVGFIVFCFYQGIKHEKDGKEGERKSSSADQDMQKKNQELNESFESDFPSSDLYIGSPIEHTFHQPQQTRIKAC
ncbi:hypothetical protein [Wolbachia endosymbiont of Folsomia candida]|uniref:hypothetical protein n=1 Tax=Wolbachia endosymbiont of Folsomia candida TaxID=169402 RepID=UPI00130080C1|nr:hypothetical protein [Wolbachia endosymbiont of Folsomia candida]